ncbi:MAG: site-2 protease family protein [Polyangiaceae bacterium]|nr:site-2 protease family protein [Polyangiaceae bacterium]
MAQDQERDDRDDADDQDDRPSEPVEPPKPRLALHAALFVVTFIALLYTGAGYGGDLPENATWGDILRALPSGWKFAVPLMAILLVHELGHYVAARIHRVPASLPFFVPAPGISPFGTFGAVILMPGRIKRRDALLDIGAAGPLAGLIVAIPVVIIGLSQSVVEPLPPMYQMEGQSLFYLAMKRAVLGPIADGSDVLMNATAFAGWTGLFVTALNLLPIGQLDGGHIAYALVGPTWDRWAKWAHRLLLAVFAFNVVRFLIPTFEHGGSVAQAIGNSTFWLFWFLILGWMRRRTGMNHPPFDAGPLSPGRRLVAAGCLVLFVLLFMPTPWATHGAPRLEPLKMADLSAFNPSPGTSP